MMKHLKYDLITAHVKHDITKHAQVTMKELGITYTHSTPQSMSDSWWFWNCENLPDILPSYLTELKIDPMEAIGWGLSQEKAESIRDYKTQQG